MPRLAGIDIPENKRTEISLRYIYGIGPTNVYSILEQAKVDGAKRAKDLTEEEIGHLQKIIDAIKVEGDLRKEIAGNINRLREIKSYRGSRHSHSLPSRGQRTRTNARTKRGKRVTIGALKKEDAAKLDAAKTAKPTEASSKETKK